MHFVCFSKPLARSRPSHISSTLTDGLLFVFFFLPHHCRRVCLRISYHYAVLKKKSFKFTYTKQETQPRTRLWAFKFPSHFLVLLLWHLSLRLLLLPSSPDVLCSRGAGLSSYYGDAPSYLGRLNQSQFKMASSAIKPCLSFIVPCFISDTPDPCFSPLTLCNLCYCAGGLYPLLCCIFQFLLYLQWHCAVVTKKKNRKHQITSKLSVFTEMCYLAITFVVFSFLFCRPSVTKMFFLK